MTLRKFLICLMVILSGCTYEPTTKKISSDEKILYSSFGFAFIYDEIFYNQKIISKKINNDNISILHSSLKKNTQIKIINPKNEITLETKVTKIANYPKIFNVVISKKAAELLELDPDNPYVELLEVRKNKTFIAKKSDIFDEEKNVAVNAPINDVQMIDISNKKPTTETQIIKKNNYIIVISDFYYLDSANNLKKKLEQETKIANFVVKKINDKQFRLYVGPYKNFKALKSTYISLNHLGFDDLNIYNN